MFLCRVLPAQLYRATRGELVGIIQSVVSLISTALQLMGTTRGHRTGPEPTDAHAAQELHSSSHAAGILATELVRPTRWHRPLTQGSESW